MKPHILTDKFAQQRLLLTAGLDALGQASHRIDRETHFAQLQFVVITRCESGRVGF